MKISVAWSSLLLLVAAGCVSPGIGEELEVQRGAATSGFAQVNCGGPAVGTWVADTNSSGGATKSRTDLIDVGSVTNPAPMAVYQSQRYGNMTYTFSGLPASSLNLVRLHFADTHWNKRGQRLFNVSINGTQVLTSFDIVATAGAIDTALVETFQVTSSTAGKYVIAFTTVTDAATISGIEIASLSVAQKRNWLQFGGDPTHSGNNALETKITTSNYTQLKPLVGFKAFPATQSPPVIITNVTSPIFGTTDLAFLNLNGNVAGYDPMTGALLWPKSAVPGSINHGEGSPAIDPNLLYVYNVGNDGCIHKYGIGAVTEYQGAGAGVAVSGGNPPPACLTNGWPASFLTPGYTGTEYAKTSLTIGISGATEYLYVGTCNGSGGFGHVTTINLTTGAQKTSSGVSGTWARGGLPYSAALQRVIVPTVDGNFTPPTSWGYSVLALAADGTGPVDSYTPSPLLDMDHDLGSTNTIIFPGTVFPPDYPNLAVQSGKDGYLRLIDLTNMSGQNGTGHLGTTDPNLAALGTSVLPVLPTPPVCNPTGGPCPITAPIATWYDAAHDSVWLFVNGPMGFSALELIQPPNHHVWLETAWTAPTAQIKEGGVTVANNVVYYANANGLYACNALGPASSCFKVGPGVVHSHQTPVVVNGVLYFDGAAYSL